jgi:hypothetical protein
MEPGATKSNEDSPRSISPTPRSYWRPDEDDDYLLEALTRGARRAAARRKAAESKSPASDTEPAPENPAP